MHIVVVDTVLGFSLLYQLEPRANYLWILLEYSLPILCLIEGHFELSRTRYKALSLVLANWLTTAYSQQFISYICHLAQPGCESSRIEVEDISDDRLLFSCS